MPDDGAPRPQLPELARSLRGLGSSRGGDGAIEALVFGPLLDARRAAERALTADEAMRAFDAVRLGATLQDAVRSLAASRMPGRDDRRRALEAELEELVAPLVTALDVLAETGEGDWPEWVNAVQRVFTAADRVSAQLSSRVGQP